MAMGWKELGLLLLGIGASVVTDLIQAKQIEMKIDEKLDERLGNLFKRKGK